MQLEKDVLSTQNYKIYGQRESNGKIIYNNGSLIKYIKKIRENLEKKIRYMQNRDSQQDEESFVRTNSSFMKLGLRKHRNYYKLHEISRNSLGPAGQNSKNKLKSESISQKQLFNSGKDVSNSIKKVKLSSKAYVKPDRLQYPHKIKTERSYNTQEQKKEKKSKNRSNSSLIEIKKKTNLTVSRKLEQIRENLVNPESRYENNFSRVNVNSDWFGEYYKRIPSNRENRTSESFVPLLKHLQRQNKLFQILSQQLGICLLRIGVYHELFPADVLYNKDEDRNSFYIILCGMIALMNGRIKMKKFMYGGDTLGEQLVFGKARSRKMLQTAKSITKSYVLEIKVRDFIRIEEQTKKYGFYSQFQQLQDQLRNRLTMKNMIRNQHLLDHEKQFYS